jgi:ParB-like chromosome segregation protein Spo0J
MTEIILVKINEVKLNDSNPRFIKDDKYAKLLNSLREFPEMLQKRPIIVDENMVALGGNMRLRACKELKLKEVPVIVAAGWTEEQKQAFIIKDNISFGQWDYDVLANTWDVEKLEDWGMDMPSYDLNDEELSDDFSLPEGDKNYLEQITFTISSMQAEQIKEALAVMKRTDEFKIYEEEVSTNENSNGNAIALIVEQWTQMNN